MDKVTWIVNRKYPKGTTWLFVLIILSMLLLLFSTICIHYPTYQTFYGVVEETEKPVLKIVLSKEQLEPFQQAIVKNKIKLKKINTEQITSENIIYAYVVMSISKKLLVKNNIVPIRLKIKNVSLWEELNQKWKEGIKNETDRARAPLYD